MPITKINSLGVDLTSPVTFSAGTVSLPSITFTGDTNTGVFAPAADTIAFTEGGTEAMRINSSGNVGIGISTPATRLDLKPATDVAQIYLTQNNTDDGWKLHADSSIGGLSFKRRTSATDTDRMKITSGGDVGIGLTPSQRFQVGFSAGSDQLAVFRDDSVYTGNGGVVIVNRYNDTTNIGGMKISSASATSGYITFHTGGTTERLQIDTAGALILAGSTAQKATGTTWSNPSDTRLKDNKQNYTKGLQELLQINVKTWEWNGKAGTTQGDVGIGVIADEIETILPNTIDTYKAKLNKDDTEQTDIKRFDATEITWLLLNSVKEQQAIIEELKARLTALESK